MIVAVAVMWMMQAARDQIIHMVAMWHCRMSAVGPVDMVRRMARSTVRTNVRMRFVHRNHVFIHMVAMHVMQMAILQKIGMSFVFHRQMSTARAVVVRVVLTLIAIVH
jgi:hypothetical protein